MTDGATAAHEARLIARRALKGALASNRRGAGKKASNQPYVSKVGVALDVDGAPLFLFSTLAAHTQDVLVDNRASLLLEAPTEAINPLEGARCTLMGRMKKLSGAKADAARATYLAHHPGAARYAGFGDFALWRMDIDKIQFVGGFGVAKWAKASDFLTPSPELVAAQDRLLDHLNADKLEDVHTLIQHMLGQAPRGWQALRIDADGLCVVDKKGTQGRLDFTSPAKDVRGWRGRFKTLLKRSQA